MSCSSIAYAINKDTGALTKFTDFDYQRIWQVNGRSLLVGRGGIYEIKPNLPAPAITATVQLAQSNLGKNELKRVPYLIADGDGDVTVTPIFDDVAGMPQKEQFKINQRVKLGRGYKGRWFAVKIVSQSPGFTLTALDFYPEVLQRKVK